MAFIIDMLSRTLDSAKPTYACSSMRFSTPPSASARGCESLSPHKYGTGSGSDRVKATTSALYAKETFNHDTRSLSLPAPYLGALTCLLSAPSTTLSQTEPIPTGGQ